MNLTDQALLLFRRLHKAEAPGHIKYKAYLRWKRRNARQAGTIAPASIWAQRKEA